MTDDIFNDSMGSEVLLDLTKELPTLPVRETIIFPGSVAPLLLGREISNTAIREAQEHHNGFIFLSLQINSEIDDITERDIYKHGVIAKISSQVNLPNGLSKVLCEGILIGTAREYFYKGTFISGHIEPIEFKIPNTKSTQEIISSTVSLFKKYSLTQPDIPRELINTLDVSQSPLQLLNSILPFIKADIHLKQKILEAKTFEEYNAKILEIIQTNLDVAQLNRKIEQDVRNKIQKTQKEFLLNEQLKMIHEELGNYQETTNPEYQNLLKQLKEKNLGEELFEKVHEELKRLPILPQSSPEYSVVRTYIDWFLHLPFNQYTNDNLTIARVKRLLNKNHFGLKDIKERILEHIAVLKLTEENNTPILCLSGPPGVGKTTLSRSIAEALGRKFIRISLGGVRDEAEIRGHRRTYIGSMPGRIIQSLKRCKSMNPLILLDEIDKMSSDFRGDPAAALLELLDPEQNKNFTDHYLETGIDLSKVLFIATANVESRIPEPLLDRMEIIRLSGYHPHEKIRIAHDHLIPKLKKANGIEEEKFDIEDDLLNNIIREYTRESGVRGLEKEIDKIMRKRAVEIVTNKKYSSNLSQKDIVKYLGIPRYNKSKIITDKRPGIVTGLAWTPVGGEILQIECVLLAGKGKLSLTGTLGDVMKESAQIALTLVRERAAQFKIDSERFQNTDIHIHLPEGAIPKDGPSAGIGLTLCILSAFTEQMIPSDVAFTGEVSLTGQCHAIGGLPEKSIAALEAGVNLIMLPTENIKDASELPQNVKKGVKMQHFDHIDQIIKKLFNIPKK